uniref:Uncharacterized protein n=1 Tax=Glossina austeni TaxID=7395 RepID=A0A1A9V3R0_GLOAU
MFVLLTVLISTLSNPASVKRPPKTSPIPAKSVTGLSPMANVTDNEFHLNGVNERRFLSRTDKNITSDYNELAGETPGWKQ